MASTRNDQSSRNHNNHGNRHRNHHNHRGGTNRNRNNRFRNPHSNRPTASMQDYSQEWLDSIQKIAGSCLQNHNSTMEDLNVALNYLNKLEAQLLVKERKWHFPPNMLPPLPGSNNAGTGRRPNNTGENHPRNNNNSSNINNNNNNNNTEPQLHGGHQPSQPLGPATNAAANQAPPLASMIQVAPSAPKTSNRYALFQDDDDDDDDDDEDEDDLDATTIADDEAGDQITFHPQNSTDDATATTKQVKEPYIAGMDMRRIMIRIYNAQSDIFAAQAFLYRRQYPPEWMNGANKYSHCLHKIHSALLLADTEISKWISYMYKKNSQENRRHRHHDYPSMYTNKIIELLTEDADIVQVAVQTMASNRAQYITAAKQLESKLLKKLRPQWRARDEAKGRMGVERWTNNTNPKNDFAQLRVEFEEELKDIRKAIDYLESSELDTTTIEMESKLLHERIQMGQEGPLESTEGMTSEQPLPEGQEPQFSMNDMEPARPIPPQQPPLINQPPPQVEQEILHSQRYNGLRPSDLSRRVDVQLYPDPALFGWIFTGSHGVTEFFEISSDNNEIIKLDWYFTTGTIKTSMNHPVQGHTQLFAARVDPDMYRAILQNPRMHTGQRYHQRHHNNNNHYHRNRH